MVALVALVAVRGAGLAMAAVILTTSVPVGVLSRYLGRFGYGAVSGPATCVLGQMASP